MWHKGSSEEATVEVEIYFPYSIILSQSQHVSDKLRKPMHSVKNTQKKGKKYSKLKRKQNIARGLKKQSFS